MNFPRILYRFRFLWLNLLFAGYLWVIQPIVFQRMEASAQGSSPDWLMGGILLGIQAFEMIGLLLKRPACAFHAQRYPGSPLPDVRGEGAKVSMFVFAPIFHICVSALLTMVALDLLKMTARHEAATLCQWLTVLVFIVVLAKEAFYAALLIGIGLPGLSPGKVPAYSKPQWVERLNRWLSPPLIDQITLKDALKDIIGDVLLLIFAALAYTASWELLTAGALHRQGAERLSEYLGVSILFVTVFFATRSVYLMKDLSTSKSRAGKIVSWVSFLVTWLAALWSIPAR